MNNAIALKWAARYVVVSFLAALVGGALVVAGLAAGAGQTLGLLATGVTDPGEYLATVGPGIGLVVLGVLVYWLGRGFALYRTLAPAIGSASTEGLDMQAMKSDLLSVLDDRLAEMHTELTETRREVNRLSRDDAAEDFEF